MKSEYKIPESNLPEIERRIGRLNRKGAKLGLDPIMVSYTGESFRQGRQLTDELSLQGVTYAKVKLVHVEVDAPDSPIMAGWQFCASLAPLPVDSGEVINVIRSVPEAGDLPDRFRSARPDCEHCHTDRRRLETFVLRNTVTGEYKQVGRNCLGDFGSCGNAHDLAKTAELLASLGSLCGSAEDEGFGGSGHKDYFDLETILVLTARVIRISGWVSRARANDNPQLCATATYVDEMTFHPWNSGSKEAQALAEKYSDKAEADDATAAEAHAWALALDPGSSDYLWNLLAVARCEQIDCRSLGLACSMVAAYLREMDRLEALKHKSNEFGGTVGARVTMELTVTKATGFESAYGTGTRWQMEDAAGNCFVWWSTSSLDLEFQAYKLTFTIKDHTEYKERKQTIITRAKIATKKKARAAPARGLRVRGKGRQPQ
jgi:hypothetical protein